MDTPNIEQNQSPFPAKPAPRSGNIGPLAAAVVIVAILAAGGFYFFRAQQQKQQAQDAAQALQATQEQQQAQESAPAPAANDAAGIESDLNATQTSGGDADVSSLNDAL
jgi:uncharacterized protein HemX